jgi:hypothetical protein
MYNPTELTLEKGVQLAEINIPGLDAPLQQFVRGQAEKLSVELFFDTSDEGMGANANPVTTLTDQIYMLGKVEATTHAPPIVVFVWGDHFPGSSLSYGSSGRADPGQTTGGGAGNPPSGNQTRNSFTGVVESIRQQFTLFSPEGTPLRAKINLVLREYRTLEEQLNQLNLNSPDRTHAHVLRTGETLSSVAGAYYMRANAWRKIAEKNGLHDPRRLTSGTTLVVPRIARNAS